MTSKKTRPLLVIDAETDPFKEGRLPRPFIWGVFDGTTQLFFETGPELIAYLKTRAPCVVYAHNGGRFDFHFLNAFAEPYTRIMSINGRVAKFKIGKIEFRDSYCILPVPLSSYQKTEIDYDKMEADVRHLHMDEIRRYLADDCRFLFDLVTKFVETYGRGLTLAGCAMKFWLDQTGREKPISDKDYYEQFSKYYYGGRVECFAEGVIDKPFKMFDINSAYPFAMLNSHPFSTIPVRNKGKGKGIMGPAMYTIVGIAKSSLPFRTDKGEIYFPCDDEARTYHVTGWEIMAALETDSLKVVTWVEHWTWHEIINFQNYIYHFYEMKKNSAKSSAEYIFAKLFMNSLYGKFCANPDNYENLAVIPQEEILKVTGERDLNIDGMRGPWRFAGVWGEPDLVTGTLPLALVTNKLSEDDYPEDWDFDEEMDSRNESDYLNVATGASITGFVRAYLWKHIHKVRKAGGKVLYCDTDSITCVLPDGVTPFAISNELGDWGCDGEFTEGGIAGKKVYAFKTKEGKWKTACKGARLEADDIMRVVRGEKVRWTNHAPTYKVMSTPQFLSRVIQKTAKVAVPS